MTIDWGDGTVTSVTSVDDYVHSYDTAGKYHITVSYDDWENVTLTTTDQMSNPVEPIRQARSSIAKVYTIPKVANTSFSCIFLNYTHLTEVTADIFANNPQITNFFRGFQGTELTALPDGLFANNTLVTNFSYCFYYCDSITDWPQNLFRYNTAITTINACLMYCTGFTGKTLYIGSSSITNAEAILSSAGTGNTIYVPAGSRTYTTFSNLGAVSFGNFATLATFTP